MKKIEAIVRKERFSLVDEALRQIPVGGLTYSRAEGRGRSKGAEIVGDRGTKTYQPEYVERIRLEIVVRNSDADRVLEAILKNATTGSAGDGKIFVSSIDQAYDIGSRETGEKAI